MHGMGIPKCVRQSKGGWWDIYFVYGSHWSLLSVWIGHGLGIAVNDEISFYIKNDCMMIVKNYRSFIVNAITILTLRGEYRSNDKQCNVS